MSTGQTKEGGQAFGDEEGAVCWRNGCQGIIVCHEPEGCSCHISPPCSSCTAHREYCPECDWSAEVEDRAEYLNGFCGTLNPGAAFQKWEPRPLDPRKIDYRISTHRGSDGLASTCSQIVEGVYPEGTTSAEVLALVRGTFGGGFEQFGGGRFKYVAYTD